MASLLLATAGFTLPSVTPRSGAAHMKCIDDFAISKVIKEVRVFDGSYDADICEAVTQCAQACIAEKGSFSLAIPGGSVVAALGGLESGAFDTSKTHVFFCNEKIPSYPCIDGALAQTEKIGIPAAQVYGVSKEGTPAEVAAKYTELLSTHPSIDNSGSIPSFDMMLLGTGPDAHCGCLFPDSAEIKATGSGAVVLAGNDDRADGDFIAISMDVMCAAKVVIVSAAGAGRAEMVKTALSGEFGAFDCPAGLVDAVEETFWFVDSESIAEFDSSEMMDDDEEEE